MTATDDEIGIVRVRIERNRKGLYMATSPDITGLHVAHRDLNAILADLPNVIRLWFRRAHNVEVRVFQEAVQHADDGFDVTALTMPAHVAAACVRA